ncbi:MAG TPA: response regulator [Burkholderiales bacterium]
MPSAETPRALVVEDDEHIQRLLKFILEAEGFAVELAGDVRSARERLERSPPPALVTLDVMLPDGDGYELLALLRAKSGWEGVPVLMISARSQDTDVARGRQAGADDYLVKPFKPDELRSRVRRLARR